MNCNFEKLQDLKNFVNDQIPGDANCENIWAYLGWTSEYEELYDEALERGIDLRPLVAPNFSDIVSIVIDGSYDFPYERSQFDWENILAGEHPQQFPGITPKERLLAVIQAALGNTLHS